jgi:predicted patatin/cPLA2 family phospholipase
MEQDLKYDDSRSTSGSATKRTHREDEESTSMDLDDLVSMISSKMKNLDTADSLQSLIAVFVDVLKCSFEEAAFFLDSVSNILDALLDLCHVRVYLSIVAY